MSLLLVPLLFVSLLFVSLLFVSLLFVPLLFLSLLLLGALLPVHGLRAVPAAPLPRGLGHLPFGRGPRLVTRAAAPVA
ncbi:hypothetical protein AB0J37_25420, partial [Microbispora rosea]|uniref:hypothetical protein n=1 Tax=Microbispora rosea TaxID=58117 RepID=UPI003439C4EA